MGLEAPSGAGVAVVASGLHEADHAAEGFLQHVAVALVVGEGEVEGGRRSEHHASAEVLDHVLVLLLLVVSEALDLGLELGEFVEVGIGLGFGLEHLGERTRDRHVREVSDDAAALAVAQADAPQPGVFLLEPVEVGAEGFGEQLAHVRSRGGHGAALLEPARDRRGDGFLGLEDEYAARRDVGLEQVEADLARLGVRRGDDPFEDAVHGVGLRRVHGADEHRVQDLELLGPALVLVEQEGADERGGGDDEHAGAGGEGLERTAVVGLDGKVRHVMISSGL